MSEQTIIKGDCLEVMRGFADKSFDLVLTDPPYGIDLEYDTYSDTEQNLKSLIDSILPEMKRVGKRVAVFAGVHNLHIYGKSDWIIAWTWNTTGSYGKFGYNQWQPILLWGDDLGGFGNVNSILKSDRLDFSGMASAGYSKNDHPCPKPEKVMQKIMGRLSNEEDTILDPFMGSGTTLVAAKYLNRNATGIEISDKYCEIARNRLSQSQLF